MTHARISYSVSWSSARVNGQVRSEAGPLGGVILILAIEKSGDDRDGRRCGVSYDLRKQLTAVYLRPHSPC